MTDFSSGAERPEVAAVDVSVIMPVFNTAEYVGEAVASVLAQRDATVELIVVDDASTDGSLEAARTSGASDPRVRILAQPRNLGVSAARNVALAMARGRYVLFLDSDDSLRDDTASVLSKTADEAGADLVYFDAETVVSMAAPPHTREQYDAFYTRSADYTAAVAGAELFATMLDNDDWRPSACLQLVRREWLELEGIRFPEGLLHEDNLFSAQVALKARRALHIPDRLYRRRVRTGSITSGAPTPEHVQSLLEIARRFDEASAVATGIQQSLLQRMSDRMRADATIARQRSAASSPTTEASAGRLARLLRRLAGR